MSRSRVLGPLAAVGLSLLVAVAAFWAGRVTLRPQEVDAQASRSFVDVEVTHDKLGRVLTVSTTVRRQKAPLVVNPLAGVVTAAAGDGKYDAGAVLYRVGATPVVLIQGGVPFWRDLGDGAQGRDVAQVERFLSAQGFAVTVDGRWLSSTTSAMKAWQKSIGAPETGTLDLGEMVAVRRFPVAVDVDEEKLWPGAVLSGGESVVSVPRGEPSFVMELTESQAAMIRSGTPVTIQSDGDDWRGVSGDVKESESGFSIPVTAPSGGAPCRAQCDRLPASDQLTLLTEVAVQEPASGPVVPVAALSTNPDGSTSVEVVAEDGKVRDVGVTVIVVADGLAVVDGIEAGERVRVFGSDEPSQAASEAP